MSFLKLHKISLRNGDIMLSPLSNVTVSQTGKNGFGRMTIAVPNDWVIRFNTQKLVGGLVLTTKEEYESEESQ